MPVKGAAGNGEIRREGYTAMVIIGIWMKQKEFAARLCSQLAGALGREAAVILLESSGRLPGEDLSHLAAEDDEDRRTPDILIMDVDDAGGKGIELAGRRQKSRKNMRIIFLAQSPSAVTEIFKARPSDFFLKPVKTEEIILSVKKIIHELEKEDRNYFVITFKGCVFQIKTKDILYFESQKRTVILHCREEEWVVYRRLDEIQARMPDYFVRCHQSYLVNMNEIVELKAFRLELPQGRVLPISRPRYRQTRAAYLDFLGANIAI